MSLANLQTLFQSSTQNASQAKGLTAAYQLLIGGVPTIDGYTFLINNNNDTNFGAGDTGRTFNDENIYINTMNALYQGNATAKASFDAIATGATLQDKLISVYNSIIPASEQTDAGRAYFISQSGFYTARAAELGISGTTGAALVGAAALIKIAVDNDIKGIGDNINDFLAAVQDGTAQLPQSGAAFTALDVADGTKYDDDDASSSAGPTVTLTTGLDALNGTAQDDLFIGTTNATTPAQSTSNLGDSINGGAGYDTVRIVTDGNAVIPSLTNVESLVIVDNVHDSRDVSGIAGLQNLTLQGGTTPAADDITLTVAAGQAVSFDGVKDGDAADDAASKGGVVITSAAGVTSQSIALNNAGAATAVDADLDLSLTGTGVTTVNLASTGANYVSLGAVAATKTVNVTGDGSTTIVGALANTVTTVDASTATGSVDVAMGNGDITFKGGAGADTLRIALADLNAKDSLNGGAGNDTLVVNAAAATTITPQQYALLNGVAAFETIAFKADAALTVDAALLDSTSIGAQDDDGTGAVTVTNLATADTVVAINTGAVDAGPDVVCVSVGTPDCRPDEVRRKRHCQPVGR